MPFDFNEYQQKVNTLSTEQLHKEWENYTRQIAGGATSTATAVLFSPLTAGVSLVGLGLSAPRIHNARKKRAIIEAGLQARGATHNTRKRDVALPMVISGAIGGVTLGLAGPGADMLAGEAAGHGAEYVVSHVALEGTGAVIEHTHTEHEKKKGQRKLQAQYQNFQQQEKMRLYGPPPVGIQNGMPLQPGPFQYPQQIPGQEPVYEPVPVPAAHRHSIAFPPTAPPPQFTQPPLQPQIAFQPVAEQQQLPPGAYQIAQPAIQPQIAFQPASHQQQFYQPTPAPQTFDQPATEEQQRPQSTPIYPPTPAPVFDQSQEPRVANTASGFSAQAGPIDSSYFPEQSAAYVASIPKLGQDGRVLPTEPLAAPVVQAGPIDSSYFPEKSAAYASSIPRLGQDDDSIPPCETPAPAYSEPENGVLPTDGKNSSPPPPQMTLEEEIELLKMKLLAMELQKRGETLEVSPETLEPAPLQIVKNTTVQVEEVTVTTTAVVESQSPAQPTVSLPLESQQQPSYPPPAQYEQQQQYYAPPAPPAQPQYSAQNTTPQIQQPTAISANAVATTLPLSQPQVTVSPPLGGEQQQQSHPLPPPSPALPPRSPSIPTMQYAPPPPPSSQPQFNAYPPPPPSPYQHQASYQPPPTNIYQPQSPSPSTYNPQTYGSQIPAYNPAQHQQTYQPPKSPNPQQQYQRHDSGYYSATGTPLPVLSPSPSVVSPQTTGASQQYLHSRNPSTVSLSPMSPPPPYFPPPPGTNVGAGGKDYFAGVPQQGYQQFQPVQTQGYQGGQGWQWGAPQPQQQQQNYGPPPAIPVPWEARGQARPYEGT